MNRQLTWIGVLAALLFVPPLALAQEPPPPVAQLMQRGREAGAPTELLEQVQRRAAHQGLSARQTTALLQPAVELAEQGLPARHVLSKALEGLAKQVPPPRVAGVLGQMQQHTGRASQFIDPWLRRPEVKRLIRAEQGSAGRGAQMRDVLVENLSQSLMQQVPTRTIETVLDALPAQVTRRRIAPAEVGTAFGILADLPTVQSSPEATAALVASALDAGFGQAELRRLPAAVRAAQQRQGSAEAVTRGVAQRLRDGVPASEVLNTLFQGGRRGGGPPAHAGPPGQGGPPPGTGPPPGKGPPEGKGPPDDKGPPDGKGPPNGGG